VKGDLESSEARCINSSSRILLTPSASLDARKQKQQGVPMSVDFELKNWIFLVRTNEIDGSLAICMEFQKGNNRIG
jgi:hypothetical protein